MPLGLAEASAFYFIQNGYLVVETDEDSAATKNYYLYVNRQGSWYIMRREALTSTTNEFKFCKGVSSYVTAWTNRATQTYDFPDVIFKDFTAQ
jgi:O-glycosyl hydrolase